MKRFFLITCFLVLLSQTTCFSQEFRVGIRGGVNLTTFTGKTVKGLDLKPAWHLGMYGQYDISENLGFQPELLLSNKGYLTKGNQLGVAFTAKEQLLYLDLPLLLKPLLNEQFSLLLGVQPSYLLSGTYKTRYNKNNFSLNNDKFKNTDTYKKVDVGLVAGFQFQTEQSFDFGFRFIYGVPNIIKNTTNNIHNINLMLTAGYILGK